MTYRKATKELGNLGDTWRAVFSRLKNTWVLIPDTSRDWTAGLSLTHLKKMRARAAREQFLMPLHFERVNSKGLRLFPDEIYLK